LNQDARMAVKEILGIIQQLCPGYIVEGWVKRLQASLLLGSPDLIEHQYTEIHYEISEPNKIDKLVKSRISMAKKKAPPNHKIGEARKS
jgi:hypothetical protein